MIHCILTECYFAKICKCTVIAIRDAGLSVDSENVISVRLFDVYDTLLFREDTILYNVTSEENKTP